ncbi:MAG: phospholipid carrier-dependent glycosyltransferase [Chloroflexota bacterium]
MTAEIKSVLQRAQMLSAKLAPSLRQHGAGLALALTFGALGLLYSVTTPLFETPDEPFHFRYVRWLVEQRALPPLVVAQGEWEQGEFHQPPLYYALGAFLTAPIPVGGPEPIGERNPYATLGLPHAASNKNAVLHGRTEGMPYTGATLAVQVLRWFGVLCSMGTVFLVFRIARAVAPGRPLAALGATALAALNPQFIFASAGASNDALLTLITTLTLYVCVRLSDGQDRSHATPLALGLLVGLAGLTKLSGLAIGLVVMGAYLLRWDRRRPWWPELARPLLIVAAVALAVCGWWYVRNGLLYGDPFGMRSYHSIFGVYPQPLGLRQTLVFVVESLLSYWGVFGWMNVLASELFYTLVRLFSILAVVGLILGGLRAWGERQSHGLAWRGLALLALWALIMLVLLFRWTQTITRTQGRLLFPAIAATSLLAVLGLLEWAPRRLAVPWLGVIAALLLTGALVAPWAYIAPTYAWPARLTLENVPATLRGLDVAFGDEIFLLGYELPTATVRVGQRAHLRLYWLARKKMDQDYTFYVHLFGRGEQRISALDSYPGGGLYPTSLWIPGEVVVDDWHPDISADAAAPVAGRVRVGIYDRDYERPLAARDAQGNPLGPAPQIARLRVAPATVTEYALSDRVDANFDGKMLLLGYAAVDETSSGQGANTITLYWRALTRMAKDYTVFLHLLDAQGALVAQLDEQPLAGEYPTSFWAPGEYVRDEHVLALPRSLPAGDYRLVVGVYLLRLQAGERVTERLTLVGTAPADALPLTTITVTEGNRQP